MARGMKTKAGNQPRIIKLMMVKKGDKLKVFLCLQITSRFVPPVIV